MANAKQMDKIKANRTKTAQLVKGPKKKPTSKVDANSMFWLKQVGLMLLIVAVGVMVIVLRDADDDLQVNEIRVKSPSLSDNMSKFYSEYRMSSSKPKEEELGDFVLEVNNSEKPLIERLHQMESQQKPVSGRWVGEHKFRTFKAGTTLRSAITDYAESEGMQVIWELDKDFIVKNQFQMDNTIIGSLHTIANAIDSNFHGEVRAFVCPKQRSLVITDKSSDYLEKQCAEAH